MMTRLFLVWLTTVICYSRALEIARTCPESETCNLRMVHEEKSCMTAVYNFETLTGTVIDYDENVCILFDGNTGTQIMFDLGSNTGKQITRRQSNMTWLASESSFEEYVATLKNLKGVKAVTEQIRSPSFKLDSPPRKKITLCNNIIKDIEPEVTGIAKANKKAPITIFLRLAKQLHSYGNAFLRNIIRRKLKLNNCLVFGGLSKVVSVFAGLDTLMNKTTGNVEEHLSDSDFNYEHLFVTESGSETLAAIVAQIGFKTDVGPLFKVILRSPIILYEIIHLFGGGVYKGLYAVEALLGHLILFTKKLLSLDGLIDIAIQVISSIGTITKKKIHRVLKFILAVVEFQIKKFPVSKFLWNVIVSFLNLLLKGILIIGKVNIWSIIELIIEIPKALGLNIIVKILSLLAAIVDLPLAIATLFFRLLYFIISGQGILFVLRLLPNIKIFDLIFPREPIFLQIIKLVKPSKLISALFSGNLELILTSIPIIGDLFRAIVEAIKILDVGKDILIGGLMKNGLAATITGWIKFALGMKDGVAPSGEIHGLGMIGGGASVSASFRISISGGLSG